MWLVVICVIAGGVFSSRLLPWSDRMIRIGLYVLLIAMGMNLGRNREVLRSIPALGAEAVLFCLLACLFSLLLVILWERLFIHRFRQRPKTSGKANIRQEILLVGIIAVCLVFGLLAGRYWLAVPANLPQILFGAALVVICTAMGVTIRASLSFLTRTKKLWLYAMVPVLITIGSVGGGLFAGLISGRSLIDSAAIAGTMAFYSFASVVITQQSGIDAGLLAVLSNILREILTFAAVPFLARFSDLSAFAVGGASTMDVTLPVIKRSLPDEYTLLAIFNGVVLSVLVPLLLILLYSLA